MTFRLHVRNLIVIIVVDIDVATPFLCLVESTSHSDSCCDLHQSKFPGRSLYCIGGIAFPFAVGIVVAVIVEVGTADYPSLVTDFRIF
jgi:hypothetical protein